MLASQDGHRLGGKFLEILHSGRDIQLQGLGSLDLQIHESFYTAGRRDYT
jgi:hypothetical protein